MHWRQPCRTTNGIGPRRTLRTPHIKLSKNSFVSLTLLDFILVAIYNYSMDLPVALLQRLATEGTEALTSLAEDADTTGAGAMRAYANRRLNTMVPKALGNLSSLLDSSDPKTQLAAVSKVLDTAPATKPLDPRQADALGELPESAINALVAGLAAFGRGLGIGLTNRPQGAEPLPPPAAVLNDVIVEVIPDAPKRRRGRPKKESKDAV